jgi:hypothetical protein
VEALISHWLIVAQSISNFGNGNILIEDNIINNVVHQLNEKSYFARILVTDHDVRAFFKRKDEISSYLRTSRTIICLLFFSKTSYCYHET